jgi:phosphoglycerol transferase
MARQQHATATAVQQPSGGPFPSRVDLAAVAGLVVLCTLAWCSANGVWSLSALQEPTAYLDPEKADVIHIFAAMKAGAEGQFVPCLWKEVRELGAPYGANWTDWPTIEEFQWFMFGMLSRTFGVFPGMSIGMLIGHWMAAITFYAVARHLDCAPRWAFLGGLAFGLAPYIFAQSPHHFTVQYCWHIPLFVPIWRWVSTDPGLSWGSRRFWFAMGVAFFTGVQNQYFTNIFCQLTLLGALVLWARGGSRASLHSALAVIAVAAAGFCLMNVDTWTYGLAHGRNTGALVREYKWLEIYGLKIKDLVIPPPWHRGAWFADFSVRHRQLAPLLDEAASYQGIVGFGCLVWLIATAVWAVVRHREREIAAETWQLLWVFVMFTTGGLNAIIGAFGFTLFRGGTRYTIVILAITLMYAARRLSRLEADEAATVRSGSNLLWPVAAAAACLVILWDQVPRPPTSEEKAVIARQVAADREFAERIEAALPEAAMVFQMPVMEFPESPAPGVPPYDHFRPYLYTKNLRFSFGSMKGRDRERWQPAVQARFFEGAALDPQANQIRCNPENARAAVDELRRLGFSAIYVNRNGFPDRAKGLENMLLDLGYTAPPIRNATGDLACFVLEGRPAADSRSTGN